MIRPLATTMALAAALLSGCGGDRGEAPAPAAAAQQPASTSTRPATTTRSAPARGRSPRAARGKSLAAVRSQFGRILADGRGQAVYVFAKERSSRSECYGACARAWPPVLTKGRPVGRRGVRSSRLGTTRRRDGSRQVTMNGKPLYYYVDDSPGRVLCHNVHEFGGLWLVVRPDGRAVS